MIKPRATNITVSTQLPARAVARLVEASFTEWPERGIGESVKRTLAVNDAIARVRREYPGLFRWD